MIRILVGAALLAAAMLPAFAAETGAGAYPNKSIRLIVPFPPGGSTDAVVRMLTPRLNDKLGQPVIVDNRGGAGGNIGGELLNWIVTLGVIGKDKPRYIADHNDKDGHAYAVWRWD